MIVINPRFFRNSFVLLSTALVFYGCSAKVPNTTIVLENKYVDVSKERPYNLFHDKEEDKYYDDARVSKIWVDAYVTSSNIRVREQFVDIFTKQARFVNTDFTPEEDENEHR